MGVCLNNVAVWRVGFYLNINILLQWEVDVCFKHIHLPSKL
jgi:hypothetical protein